MIEELNRLTVATTAGGFWEALAGRWLSAEFVTGGFQYGRRGKVSRARRRKLGWPSEVELGRVAETEVIPSGG